MLTCLLAALTGIVCYWVGLTRAEEPVARAEPARVALPRPGAPGLLKLERVSALDRETIMLVRDRAYVEGRKDGLEEGRRAAARRLEALRRAAREAPREPRRRRAG